jgi:hypothetical protein
MKNLFLLHHLGLGDHIITNGLVRTLAEHFDNIVYPVKHHNLENIKKMFCDLENIQYISIKDDKDMLEAKERYRKIFEILPLGCFEQPRFIRTGETFCQSFYRQASVPYENRWSKFHAPQDEEKQNALASSIEGEYLFVHDDASRNLLVKNTFLQDRVYRPKHNLGDLNNFSIFDYKKIICSSKEIHCMDSSFAAFIDHIPECVGKPKYIHRYIRKDNQNPQYKNGWAIII